MKKLYTFISLLTLFLISLYGTEGHQYVNVKKLLTNGALYRNIQSSNKNYYEYEEALGTLSSNNLYDYNHLRRTTPDGTPALNWNPYLSELPEQQGVDRTEAALTEDGYLASQALPAGTDYSGYTQIPEAYYEALGYINAPAGTAEDFYDTPRNPKSSSPMIQRSESTDSGLAPSPKGSPKLKQAKQNLAISIMVPTGYLLRHDGTCIQTSTKRDFFVPLDNKEYALVEENGVIYSIPYEDHPLETETDDGISLQRPVEVLPVTQDMPSFAGARTCAGLTGRKPFVGGKKPDEYMDVADSGASEEGPRKGTFYKVLRALTGKR